MPQQIGFTKMGCTKRSIWQAHRGFEVNKKVPHHIECDVRLFLLNTIDGGREEIRLYPKEAIRETIAK